MSKVFLYAIRSLRISLIITLASFILLFQFCGCEQKKDNQSEQLKTKPLFEPKDLNGTSLKHHRLLKELYIDIEIGTVHTLDYYRKTEQVKDNELVPEITRARLLSSRLANIAQYTLHHEIDAEERLLLLEHLSLVQSSVLEARPLGIGNVILADIISLLKAGLIFQAEAEMQVWDLTTATSFADPEKFLRHYYTPEILEELLQREFEYNSSTKTDSYCGLLLEMVRFKYPDLVKEYEDKGIPLKFDSIANMALFSASSEMFESRDPLNHIRPLYFVFFFLNVRRVEFLCQMSLSYRNMRREKDDRFASFMHFKEQLLQNMTPCDKSLYGELGTDMEVTNMAVEISSQIKEGLRSKGQRYLRAAYGMFLACAGKSEEPNGPW